MVLILLLLLLCAPGPLIILLITILLIIPSMITSRNTLALKRTSSEDESPDLLCGLFSDPGARRIPPLAQIE